MNIEDMGNAVKIGDTIIPAVNIQVDDSYPLQVGAKEFPGLDTEGNWWGYYFEILFEDGSLWVLAKDFDKRPRWNGAPAPEDIETWIEVQEYENWARDKDLDDVTFAWFIKSWEDFLRLYYRKLERIELRMIINERKAS